MGRWGTYPSDSDGALDMLHPVDQACNKVMQARLTRITKYLPKYADAPNERFDFVGAVQLLLQRGVFVDRVMVEQSVKFLTALLTNKKFMAAWCNTVTAKRALKDITFVKEQMAKLLQPRPRRTRPLRRGRHYRMRRHCPCILAPRGWLQRRWQKPGASWTGLFEQHHFGRERKWRRRKNA